jgi:hypothetical protein
MKLDDRPVIDQLLNPTPLNILEDVAAELDNWLQRLAARPASRGGHSNEWLEGAGHMLEEFTAELEARL